MIWILNAIVLAIVMGVAYLASIAGWQLCLAYIVGFLVCYIGYGVWRYDYDDPVIDGDQLGIDQGRNGRDGRGSTGHPAGPGRHRDLP